MIILTHLSRGGFIGRRGSSGGRKRYVDSKRVFILSGRARCNLEAPSLGDTLISSNTGWSRYIESYSQTRMAEKHVAKPK
jgi:hypothetical protein